MYITESIPSISISDFKDITNDHLNSSIREIKILKLKTEIDNIIETGSNELEDILAPQIIDSSAIEPINFDCTVYYLSGYSCDHDYRYLILIIIYNRGCNYHL